MHSLRFGLLFASAYLFATAGGEAATQTVTLKPGWNAVWLTVQPNDTSPEAVFANVPVAQVWCWFPTESPVEFIDNPERGLFNVDGWRCYFPQNQQNAFLSNLTTIQSHRPYLIKLDARTNVVLTVRGSTAFKPLKWRADSFNLVGFHVDTAVGGGAAGAFFFNAPAHRKQSMHYLDPAGDWRPMPESAPIRAGEAYWIFSKGMSQFNGPIEVKIDGGDFDFGTIVSEKQITLTNDSAFESAVKIDTGGLPLVVASESSGATTTMWTPLATLARTVPAGGKAVVRIGVQRANLSGPIQGTVTISAPGVSLPYPVSVGTGAAAAARSSARASASAIAPAGNPDGGLWIGLASLNKVNDVNDPSGGPVPTPAEFSMRFIVHVDAGGTARLLKQVILMRKRAPVGQPAPLVLITDDNRLPEFTGAELKDGKPFGYRVSSIGYDFAGNELAMDGGFGSALTGTVVVDRNLPTNPMKHRYHPDHDDLDAQYRPLPNPPPANATPDQDEVWQIIRKLELVFDAAGNSDRPSDAALRTGTYRETLTGLHRQGLVTEGTFTLRRINQLTELNPAP
jgi:hypothetical protein